MIEYWQHLAEGFGYVAGVVPLLTIVAGVVLGLAIGAMPGLSPSMGVALLVPFTYSMSPALAMVLLTSLYLAADFGGAITAVTMNTPGTPSSVVTALDGYPLTRQGKAGHALGVSMVSSAVGGLIGTLILIFFSVPLARLALRFYPTEYFALAVLGLTAIATVGGKDVGRAFVAVLIGLVLNTVGVDPISGVSRFSTGIGWLSDGFGLIPALIGLFALSEILMQVEARDLGDLHGQGGPTTWPTWREYWSLRGVIFRSSWIGTLIGILPGAGATIASFVAYDVAKRTSRAPEQFGHGALEGVAASEAANSSCVGGSLIPMLTLGLPGSASTAVLISALMIHRVVPGPTLFTKRPDIVYGLFASLLVANFVALVLGLVCSRSLAQITTLSKQILYPVIVVTAVIGSYAVNSSLSDVYCCLGFGVGGWLLRRQGFPVAPIVLGLVLGRLMEVYLRQAVMLGGWSIFLHRWPSLLLLLLSGALLLAPILRRRHTGLG